MFRISYRIVRPPSKGDIFYVKDTPEFLEKLKYLCKVLSYAILFTTDVVILYPSIPHKIGLKALYKKLTERVTKKIPSSDLINIAELKIIYL